MPKSTDAKPFDSWLTAPDERGCRLFTGFRMKNGYGTARLNNPRRKALAHRVAWERAYGAIPAGLWVLHRCDVRACCEPTHLFLGTARDNVNDMIGKGRHVPMRGTRSPRAKLTESEVAEIRSDERADALQLAIRFGVARSTIYAVRNGRSYPNERSL